MNSSQIAQLAGEGLSSREIAEKLNISQTSVMYWIRKEKTQLSPGYGDGACKCRCGETSPERFYKSQPYLCIQCFNTYKAEKASERRLVAITELGGKCVIPNCGYSKYTCALDVHHVDPAKKDPNFDSMRFWSIERIRREIKHCVLLCKNCHAAVHAGHIHLPE